MWSLSSSIRTSFFLAFTKDISISSSSSIILLVEFYLFLLQNYDDALKFIRKNQINHFLE